MVRHTVAALAILAICTSPSFAQTSVRDVAKPQAAGTASVTGTIVTDETDPRPLRRVRVGLTSSDRRVGRTTVTDDVGRFSFAGLPAGRFLLTATKSGYVTTSFGAHRPNRQGTAIGVADGQRITGLTLRMPRGAVITGIVTDQNGDPMSGASVTAMRYVYAGSGQRTLLPTAPSTADDRGHYRIWGLAAGEYVISANVGTAQALRADQEITRTTDADVKRALSELNTGTAAGGQGSSVAIPRATKRTVGYAAVYYPGTFSAPQATAITVAAGEERSGADFPLSLVPTAKLEGTVSIPEGVNQKTIAAQLIVNNPHSFMLDMFRRATVTADGSFTFASVPPGNYTIAVTAQSGAPGPGLRAGQMPAGPMTPPAPSHWAMVDVAVDGQDISGVSLQLQPGLIVSGRVEFDGTGTPPDVTRIRLSMMQPLSPGMVALGVSSVQPDVSGAFTIRGITPGTYRLTASIPTLRTDTQAWQLKSSTINGRDTLDGVFELRAGADDAVVTFTDKATELTGTVQDAAGQPAPEYHIVVFSADKSHWVPTSRRIRYARPGADGKFQVPNLPPGEYLVAAVNDIEPGEWFDPAVLDQLSRTAIALALVEGEKKVQDLKLGAPIR